MHTLDRDLEAEKEKTEDNYDRGDDALPKLIALLTKMYVNSKLMTITGSLNGNFYMSNAHIYLHLH